MKLSLGAHSSMLVASLALMLPVMALAQTTTQYFEVAPTSINSGQTVTLSWKVTNSSGASVLLPCVSSGIGIHYKNQSGTLIACDTKLTGFGTTDSVIIGATNTSGSTVTLSPKLIPLNPDGSESTGQPTAGFSVQTDPNPISDFTVSSTTVVSGDKLTFTWAAPEVDKLNMTLYCPDEITPTIVGDSRPRVPCNQQPLFGGDLSGSGSQTFQLASSSLEPAVATFRLMPKTGSGAFDGTRSKSIQVTVMPPPDTRSPVVTSFQLSEQTLKSGQEAVANWTIQGGVGTNFKITCPSGVTATSSLTVASLLKCNQPIFDSILGIVGSYKISFQNSTTLSQEIWLTLIPAVTTVELDAVRARAVRIVVLGNPAGVTTPVASAPTSTVTTPGTGLSPATSSKSALTALFAGPITYGLKNHAGVRRLQEIMRDTGVYTGPVTGNFYAMTKAGVLAFQKKYGIPQVGLVGPMTKKKLIEVAK